MLFDMVLRVAMDNGEIRIVQSGGLREL